MEKDILTIISDDETEKYKLLAVIDKKYIIYTPLSNNDPINNIHIVKVKSLDELEVVPIAKEEIETIEEKYMNLLK